MSVPTIADTKVLVYAFDADNPEKRSLAQRLLHELSDAGCGFTTPQILAEFYVTAVWKFRKTMTPSVAATHTQDLSRGFAVLDHGLPVVIEALRGSVQYGLHFYDAQIWASALLNSIPLVLSEDFADGREIEGVHFANPFAPDFDLDGAVSRARGASQ